MVPPILIQTHTWYFTPLSCKQYALKATLVSSIPIGHPGDLEKPISISSARKKSLVNIHGLGTSGTIKVTMLWEPIALNNDTFWTSYLIYVLLTSLRI